MTLNEAQTLKPGQRLTWKGKNLDRYSQGATAYQLFARIHGETVEFLDFVGRDDVRGFPIIRIKGNSGEREFSSGWFV